MRYLITGGAGFIGSHLADYLLAAGHHVHVVDNFSTGRRENIEHLRDQSRFQFKAGDILDYSVMEPLVRECDVIFHLAAAVGVKLIMERPVETLVTNVRGTEILLELANRYGKRILLASTSEVYGKAMEVNGNGRLSETDDWTLGSTTRRRWAYACSKALDEFLALAYRDEYGLETMIARFFNTVGPRQTGRYGMVIPNFVRRALRNEPILVHGDGEQSRSFAHVNDAVRAAAALIECDDAIGDVFNIGNGSAITINELAEKVRTLALSRSKIVHVPYEDVYGPGFEDMRYRTPDISKVRKLVGYEPSWSIDDILMDVIAYQRSRSARVRVTPGAGSPAKGAR